MPPRTVTLTTSTTRTLTLGEVAHRAAYPETDWSLLHEQHRATWERAAQAVADAVVNDETPWPEAQPEAQPEPAPAPVVPDGWTDLRLDVLAFGNVGYDYATAQAAPGTVALGEVVSVRGHRLTVREVNGDLVQLNNKTHGL